MHYSGSTAIACCGNGFSVLNSAYKQLFEILKAWDAVYQWKLQNSADHSKMKKIVRYFAASVKVWKNAFPTDKHTYTPIISNTHKPNLAEEARTKYKNNKRDLNRLNWQSKPRKSEIINALFSTTQDTLKKRRIKRRANEIIYKRAQWGFCQTKTGKTSGLDGIPAEIVKILVQNASELSSSSRAISATEIDNHHSDPDFGGSCSEKFGWCPYVPFSQVAQPWYSSPS